MGMDQTITWQWLDRLADATNPGMGLLVLARWLRSAWISVPIAPCIGPASGSSEDPRR